MSNTLKSLARTLQAAGTDVSVESDGAYLFYVKDGKLQQQLYTAAGGGQVTRITTDVRSDSPALSLHRVDETEDEHFVFYFDKANVLRCARYDDEDEAWVATSLGGRQITGHPKSQLSGYVEDDGVVLVFQASSNKLQSTYVAKGGSSSTAPDSVQGNPTAGTAISVIPTDDKTHLFYLGQDMNVHHQVKNDDVLTGTWEDTVLPDSKFNSVVSRAVVLELDKKGSFEVFALAGTSVVSVTTDGKRITHGSVKDGVFEPETKEESSFHFHGKVIIKGGVFQGHGGRSRPRSDHTHRRR